MAIRSKDIYEGRKKSRSHVGLIIGIVLAVIVLLALLFYGLREYCVYDDAGNAHIVLPFTQEARDLKAAEQEPQTEEK